MPFVAFIDLYAPREQVEQIMQTQIPGSGYLVRRDVFIRNGLEVYRTYLTDMALYVRLASMYFDAWNHCLLCGSFNVAVYDHFAGTMVYCNDCRIHRGYRADMSGGSAIVNTALPEHYTLDLARTLTGAIAGIPKSPTPASKG